MQTTLLKSVTTLALTTILTFVAVAVTQAETIEVRGVINYGHSLTPTQTEEYTAGHYVLEIEQEQDIPLIYSASTWRQYANAVNKIKVAIFDAEGNPLNVQQPHAAADLNQPTNTFYVSFSSWNDYASWTLNGTDNAQMNSQLKLNLSGPAQSLFESTAEFPRFLNTPRYVNATLSSSVETALGEHVLYITGPVTEMSYLKVDADGDGVLDDVDSCPNSGLARTVVVDANDTGVTNSVDSVGCSITDKIDACHADAANRGAFVSCISQLAKQLQAQGMITRGDQGALMRFL